MFSLQPKVTPAKISKDFTYRKLDNQKVTLAVGISILVDLERGIACFGDDHFEIDEYYYLVDFPN